MIAGIPWGAGGWRLEAGGQVDVDCGCVAAYGVPGTASRATSIVLLSSLPACSLQPARLPSRGVGKK